MSRPGGLGSGCGLAGEVLALVEALLRLAHAKYIEEPDPRLRSALSFEQHEHEQLGSALSVLLNVCILPHIDPAAHYDPAMFRLRTARSGTAFGRRPAVYAEQRESGSIAIGAALNGGQVGVNGDQNLGVFVFERMRDSAMESSIEIHDAQWIDAIHRVRTPRGQMALPKVFALLPNFPNPFNPETVLRLQLPERGSVELHVYDAAGQKVRSLLAGALAAGVYTAVWDGRDQTGREVASGTYFAQLRAGNRVQTRKMTLLR